MTYSCDEDVKRAFERYAQAEYQAITARQQFERGEVNEAYARHYEGEAQKASAEHERIKKSLLPR